MTHDIAILGSDLTHGEHAEKPTFLPKDFRSEVIDGWDNVYPPVRMRMDRLLTSSKPIIFEGEGCVRRSKLGWLFAQGSKILGTPLIWRAGENVKTVVTVAPTKNGLRCWNRLFVFSDGYSQLVQTSKVMDRKLGFIDAVGAEGEKRLATKMRVWADGKSLFFESTMYVLRFKNFNVRIPSILTPGTLLAEHRDLGNGEFRYILKFDHPIWGKTFYQDGVFRMLD